MTDAEQVPRVLFWAPNWLGDVVMSSRLLDLLYRARGPVSESVPKPIPAFEIHLAIRPSWAALFRADPRLDGLMIVERDRGLRGVVQHARNMRISGIEAVLLGPPSFRTGLTAWLAGVPTRIGFRTDGRGFTLTGPLDTQVRGTTHYSEEMLELGRAFLLSGAVGDLEVPNIPEDVNPLPGCDGIPARGLGDGEPFVAVGPGTTYGEAKTWPIDRVLQLVESLMSRGTHRIAFLGDAGATSFVTDLLGRLGMEAGTDLKSRLPVLDLTGRTDLESVVGVLKAASGFVGNDSGLMHLAAGLGTPTVGVFGSSNPDWTAPLGRFTAVVAATGFPCHPCYLKRCNQPQFCLETVSADSVLEPLDRLMSRAGLRTGGSS